MNFLDFFRINADMILVCTNIMFGLMLIPQLKDVLIEKHYLNLYTCSFTFLGLVLCNLTMVSLELWLSAIPLCTILWGVILYFSWKNKKSNNSANCIMSKKRG